MMNGEIPSVPITTLAGISSLTDLLPELPLPTPLPQTMSNKSLLFHPRVAKEANILLSLRDENIVPLLTQSLSQTPAINIELKDHYAGNDNIGLDQQNIPELLKAILLRDPGVFNGFPGGNKSAPWNNQSNPKTACVVKPSVILPTVNHEGGISLNSNITNCALVNERDDIKRNRVLNNQPIFDLKASESHLSVTGAYHTAPSANNCPVYPLASGETTILQGLNESDVAVTTPSSLPRGPTQPLPGLSPVQASIAPSCGASTVVPSSNSSHLLQSQRSLPLANSFKSEDNLSELRLVHEKSELNSVNSSEMPKVDNSSEELSSNARINTPVVILNRLAPQEVTTPKRGRSSLREPRRSSGIEDVEISDSDDSDFEPKNKTKIFKAREKERELQRKRDKDGLKSSDKEGRKPDTYDKSKRRKRLSRSSGSQEKNREREPRDFKYDAIDAVPSKPKVRKIEKKLVPVIEKLSEEELMETNTYQRFNQSLERIFEDVEDIDITEVGEDGDCPSEALIPRYQLQELCSEAAKLNSLGAMDSIPINKTTRLLTILERNIRDGTKVTPISDPNDDEEERKLFLELALERVMRAVDASLTALYILTSPNMDKQVYLEDVIDRIFVFTKFQLHNTIFPAFDPVYRVQDKDKECYVGPGRKKRAHHKEVREKSVISLYAKLTEVVNRLAELVGIQILTDNAILHASTMGIAPFFVERVSDLQLACLKLVTNIFSKYDKHRKLLLDDILASMARLPSSKRSLRSYRLSGDEYIQMLTALVLQLVQCMVSLPPNMKQEGQDPDVVIVTKFKAARSTASNFLYVFLAKCSSKSEEIDYRPLFENFVQDLLTTVNKPEWPAAELMLSVLGNLLVANFVNKSLEMTLRVASLDYLGVVAARLRKDAVVSHLKQSTIDQMIKDIQAEEAKDDENANVSAVLTDEERMLFLNRVLLDYLASRAVTEPTLNYARHFYLAQWYQDNCCSTSPSGPAKKSPKKKKKRRKGDSSEDEPSSSEDEEAPKLTDDPVELYRVNETKKKFLLSKIRPFDEHIGSDGVRKQEAYIDYGSAELIARYFASKRPFSQSFDVYLKHILKVLTETSVLIRTKAMKCLTSIVEVDPSVLGLKEMQLGVSHSFLDHSTSVREAAVDLVGKFVLSRPELISKYYDMLSARILDTGVSVRKRVIKILKDVCVECPDFPKIPEICVKMIRRVNDEDGIRKLVLEVFQNMWFTPVKERPVLDKEALVRKVMNITDVVAAANDMNIEWFEQLLLSMFKPREDKDETVKQQQEIPKTILTACKQIVDCLVETVLKLDTAGHEPQRLVSCLVMLHLFAKIRPQLLIDHANTLQPYLSLKCKTQADYQIISCVAKTLELVVPLIEHPSEMFLARLEEDSVKLMMQQDPPVVLSCVSCLGSIVNNVTRNFALIRDCLKEYHGVLLNCKSSLESYRANPELRGNVMPGFRRAVFVVGLLLRFFDFTDKEVIGDELSPTIKDEVFDTFLYFLKNDTESQLYTLKAVGSVCIRHYELMLSTELKEMYHTYLTSNSVPLRMKIQVLNNIKSYLLEEERKMIKQDQEWAKRSKSENLKEMGDVTSGMASTVIQIYLKDILESFLHPKSVVRSSALKVIHLILAQGLVHPGQIVPYLICMSTDDDKVVSQSACKQLQDIDKKYPGFIHTKAQIGIKLSYKLQRIVQTNVDVIRGFRIREGELPAALNGFLYSALRTKLQRRALVSSILKQFDEQVNPSLPQMLFLADNMAYFPYQVQDEPLFIIHHIDLIISITGTNLLQSFREALIPITDENNAEDEDEDEDEESLLSRIPEDTTILQHCLTASQGCLLLLVLKQHLKTLYGFNDAKISQYSPAESGKVYEKSVSRKNNSMFNPKGTIQKLKQGTRPAILDEEARRALVSEYLEFKSLIMNLDPDEDDLNDEGGKFPDGGNMVLKVREVIAKKTEESELAAQHQDGGTPKVPKLIITSKTSEPRQHKHRKQKTEKHKKQNHKRKRRLRSSDDSEEDYSDPDFLV